MEPDNAETQLLWSGDSQPPWDVRRSLSFSDASARNEPPSAKAPSGELPKPKPTPKENPPVTEKPLMMEKPPSKEDAKVPQATAPDPKAEPKLPPKPACVEKLVPSMSPAEQSGRMYEEEHANEDDEELEVAPSRKSTMVPETDQEDMEEEHEEYDSEVEDLSECEPIHKRPAGKSKGKARVAKAKARGKAKAKAKAKQVSGKAKAKAKKVAGKAKAKNGKRGRPVKDRNEGSKSEEDKARLSRKSSAYHRAKKEALESGMTVEEACEIAKSVACYHPL